MLREIEKRDLKKINKWRNDKEVIYFLGCNFGYISEATDEQWYQNYLSNRDRNTRLSIIENESNTFIGNVNLTNIHHINRTAEFSIVIGDKKYWSKGIGESVTRRVLQHAFLDLNLNRVYLYVLEYNTRAVKMYKKVGFILEGKLEEAVHKDGKNHDLILMAILRKRFNQVTTEHEVNVL